MEIILNNTPEKLPGDQMTIRELLDYKRFTFKLLVIKINNQLVKRDEYDKALVKDGDNVMVMHLISGG